MNKIILIINSLSIENRQNFILWLKNKNRRGDVKNVILFNYLQKGETSALDTKLYGKPSKNAFHALCKRLHDSLLDFIATKSFEVETSEELGVIKLLVVSRLFFKQKEYKLGYNTLVKAEKLASFIDHYSLLNEIYHTKIQYAHCNSLVDLNTTFKQADSNMEAFQKDFKLNMAYAEIKEKILITNSLARIDAIVENAFIKFEVSINASLSYKSLYQLMNLTSIITSIGMVRIMFLSNLVLRMIQLEWFRWLRLPRQ